MVQGITKFVPKSYPGPLVRKEVLCLAKSIDVPKRPFVVVLGKTHAKFLLIKIGNVSITS